MTIQRDDILDGLGAAVTRGIKFTALADAIGARKGDYAHMRELLAALVEGAGAVASAEQLFLAVWGGREYHPLRHRNTVYVAVKRLRQTLKTLVDDDRDVIETAAGGWRLADGIDAIVVRPVDD